MTTTRTAGLELPEQIDLEFQVANVGSRTLAILADLSFCGIVLLAVYVLTTVVSDGMSDWITRTGSSALTILLLLLIFFTQWVYFFLFEWRWNGQTPGKRLLHLRVIKMDGAPVSWVDVLLRNLARPIDAFGPMGLLGLLLIFVTPRAQRLGDMMARTLVIHETPIDWSIFDEAENAPQPATAPAIRLSSVQWELLHRFLHRREELPPEVRARLAASVYAGLKPLASGTDLELSHLEPEAWLAEFACRT